ncbi:MAG TPA: heparan-alpha-glucosaminide N-acetyltransferase domain-containing protein, partial [Flavisolibacter sp.]
MQIIRTTPSTVLVRASIPLEKRSYRIESIDLLRGLVMIIMALDHTRDFFHQPAMIDDPLNFATTTPILFFTRWITHFCAPIFVFLAGTSAFFQSSRKSKPELSRFLITRGLWLVLIEIVVINFAFTFDPNYTVIGLQTIWSIGISMIILGFAIRMPFPAILATGLIIVLGHNALDF